jgi:hypothetical protein
MYTGLRGARVDTEKKSEASWDELEQVGPYPLQERMYTKCLGP